MAPDHETPEVAPQPAAPASRYRVNVPLRWSDMDAYGHVNNVQFLRLLEDARVIGFEDWFGQDRSVLDEGILVARHEIEYLAPLLFRVPPIVVEMWATKIGGAGFDLAYEVRDGRAATEATASTPARRPPSSSTTSRRAHPGGWPGPAGHARGAPGIPCRSAGGDADGADLPDAQGIDDLRTYVARAKAADEDGAIRLQASGPASPPTSACSPAAA